MTHTEPEHAIVTSTALIDDELIRHKVRQEIERQTKGGPSLWKVINSSFVLWMLSSVVLSLAVWGYSTYDARRQAERAALQRLGSLREEIAYRLDSDLVGTLFDAGGAANSRHVAILCLPSDQFGTTGSAGLLQLSGAGGPIISADQEIEKALLAGRFIHTEFRDRSIFSLLWELKKKETDPTQVNLLQAALSSISEMRSDALSGLGTPKVATSYLLPVEALIATWDF